MQLAVVQNGGVKASYSQGSNALATIEQGGVAVAAVPVASVEANVGVIEARVVVVAEAIQPAMGGGVDDYLHTQVSSAAVWTVAHNLGRRPSVTVRSVGGLEIFTPEVLHLSANTLTITFDVPFAGEAYLI